MRSVCDMLFLGLRHVAIGAAVLAVLTTALRLHVHGPAGDGHAHAGQMSLQALLDDVFADAVDPEPAEGDGCGSCNCPPAHVMAGERHVVALHPAAAALAGTPHAAAIPDSRTYPPDPPPVRPD